MSISYKMLDITILYMLRDNSSTSKLYGTSIDEMTSTLDNDYTYDTIYRATKKLVDMELLACGYKNGKKNTYYITEKGLNLIESELN